MIVDLHVNLETEDGSLVDPTLLAQTAKAKGLDGLLLTQKGVLQPDLGVYREICDAAGLTVFQGAEFATNHGLILCILPSSTPAPEADWVQTDGDRVDADSLVDAVEALGGITIALRPYDREVETPMGDHLFSLQGLTACEVQNGRLTSTANELAMDAASSMGMPYVGSSNASGSEGLGTAATLLRDPVLTETQLCELIRSGDCWPVSFSDEAPEVDFRREAARRNDRRSARGRGDRRGPERRDRGTGGRSSESRRSRGGRKRGRGGRVGARSDDVGNRMPRAEGQVAEDIGNRIKPEGRLPAEDIGNRLAPGEVSPYLPQSGQED